MEHAREEHEEDEGNETHDGSRDGAKDVELE